MKSQQIATTLGYAALVIVALYFVFGILKLSGQGLASMGFDGNTVEGFKPAELDKSAEVLEKEVEKAKTQASVKAMANWDDASEYGEYKEQLLELAKLQREMKKHQFHSLIVSSLNSKTPKTPNLLDKNIKLYGEEMIYMNNLVKFLEEDPDFDA